jgi:hypothetical protein
MVERGDECPSKLGIENRVNWLILDVLTIAHDGLNKRWVNRELMAVLVCTVLVFMRMSIVKYVPGECFIRSRESYCMLKLSNFINHHLSRKGRIVFIRIYWLICLHLL